MARLAFSSLRGRLILLVLIAVIPALGLIVYSAVEERRHIAEDVKKEALTLTQLTASNLDNFIEGARQLLISLAETQVVRNRDSAACNERFAALMKQNSLYQTIGATDEAANVFASAVPLKQPVNVKDRQWFRSVLQSRNFVVGDFIMGRITGKPTLALAYPVLDKRGVFKGTVFVTVDLTWLNQMAKEANLAPGRTLTVVDRHGTIIARYPEPGQWVGKIVSETNLVKTILTQKEGLAEIRGLDGIQRLYAFTLIHGAVDTGLYLSIGLSKEMAFKKIDQTLYRNLAALGLVAALALAVAWVAGDRLILRRVKSLVEASKRLRNGDLSARTGLSYQNGEISQLAHAFDEMAAALEQREAERKQAEEALEKALHAWQSTFEAVSDGLWILDAEGHIIHSNGKFELLLGIKPEEVLNQICYKIVHCSSYFIEDCPCMRMFRTGKPERQEIEAKDRGLWLEVSADPIRDKTGAVINAVHVVRDITERKRAEKEVRRQNQRLSVLYTIDRAAAETLELEETLNQGLKATMEALGIEAACIYLLEPDGGTMTMRVHCGLSDEFVKNVGHIKLGEGISGRAAAEGKPVVLDVPDYPSERLAPYILQEGLRTLASTPLVSAGQLLGAMNLGTRRSRAFPPQEMELLTSIGRQLGSAVRNAQLYKALQQELAERKKTEELLRQERDISQKYLDVVGVMLVVLAKDQTVALINKKGCEILGYEEGEIFGKNWFNAFIPEKNREEVKTVFTRFIAGEIEPLEYFENPVRTKNGEERIIAWHNTLVKDEKNEIIGVLASGEDLTERKQLEAQLLQSQKIEAIGTLAGGIAHDFNNLLTAIIANLELAKIKLSKKQPAEPYLEEIETVAQRATELTNRLLAFSRRQLIQPVALNLNDTLKNMHKILSRLIGEHIKLELKLEKKLGLVKADPGQIEQVIMNLCVNARDAMPPGGVLTLTTCNLNLEEDYINSHPWVEKGDYVLLVVADTGCGMDPATLEHVFEPFFTTKETGKGTGLGLSMVYGIIKQHQGYIHVYSEPGRGTTFKIYLPRTEEKISVETVKEKPTLRGGKEVILLAEDEDSLREAIQNILEIFGYTVLVAQDGREAVDIYEQEKERIDLVILDAVMPKMGGKEVADRIYKLNPSQKILFSSGYSAEGLHETFIIPADMHFIQKPYTAKALAQKVREVLEG